ncbi:hypothetical protein ILUMI_16836 [Ignelater luminosus]|uniref:Uncharacterized protein n=1 Tax=Ignelater luminosus TaxID=2038154 RepID=A0A8K0CQ80_IGNLU|nr:hypothetical protein ILUMI_16836 [Ignelater luminosus]
MIIANLYWMVADNIELYIKQSLILMTDSNSKSAFYTLGARDDKGEILNAALAQKLKKLIVEAHFGKCKAILTEHDLLNYSERIFNMDKKGCRLHLYKDSRGLAQEGSKRVYVVGKEHGECVKVMAWENTAADACTPQPTAALSKRAKHSKVVDLSSSDSDDFTDKDLLCSNTPLAIDSFTGKSSTLMNFWQRLTKGGRLYVSSSQL